MATRIEKDHVHAVYSQIAQHFSDTRFKPWPKIAEFLCSLPKGSLVADIGMVRRIKIVTNVNIPCSALQVRYLVYARVLVFIF